MSARLGVAGLAVADHGGRLILEALDLRIAAGEVVALVGPTGAGKTVALQAMLGSLPEGLVRTAGRVTWDDGDVADPRRWRRHSVGFLAQDPSSSLHPLQSTRALVMEALHAQPRAERPELAERALAEVGLGDEGLADRLPHQLSGGQAQRVALARALAADPDLLVLDEPTSGLDRAAMTIAAARLRRRRGDGRSATLIVSHDTRLVADLADHVVCLGPSEATPRRRPNGSGRPAPPPTAAAPPSPASSSPAGAGGAVLAAHGLRMAQPPGGAPILDAADLAVASGEFVAVVGPSGSGKSTLLRSLAGLHPVEAGTATLLGAPLPWAAGERCAQARKAVALVGQNPLDALNPARRVSAALLRPLRTLRGLSRPAAAAEATRLLAMVGLGPSVLRRYPAHLSGGQRQRVALARALAGQPALLLADEMTAALDARTAASVLDLLDHLRRGPDGSLSVLAVTHDEAVAQRADRVLRLTDGVLLGPSFSATSSPQPSIRGA